MTDRKQVLFGLNSPNDKTFMSQMCDKADKAQKIHGAVYTKFLAPREQHLISERLKRFVDIECYGGYEGSERNLVCFYLKDDFWGDIEFPLSVLKITATNKKVYSHRDYLGAILSLGIKRELTGDIITGDECAYVFCHIEIADYILYNLEKVANARVVIEKCSSSEVEVPQRSFKQKDDTVASMRIDCIISSALNMSRGNSLEAIKRGFVTLNYEEVESASANVGDGDVISVRGYGKFIVETDGLLTKKGRYHIHIKQYI